MPAGTIVILGDVELFHGEKPADLRRQLRKALALMVAARGRRVRRQEIAAAVWDDDDRDVRTLMWSLRRALNKARALISLTRAGDGRAARAAAARLLTEAGAAADRLGMRAPAAEAGELLAGC